MPPQFDFSAKFVFAVCLLGLLFGVQDTLSACSYPADKTIECEYPCFRDLANANYDLASYENVVLKFTQRGNENRCPRNIDRLKDLAPELKNLTILANSCPMSNIELKDLPNSLRNLTIGRLRQGQVESDTQSQVVYHEHYQQGLVNLKTFHMDSTCCSILPNKMILPALEDLSITCDAHLIVASSHERSDLPSSERTTVHIVAPNLKYYLTKPITATVFKGRMPERILSDLPKLEKVRLSFFHWQMKELPNEIFRNLPSLQDLEMKGFEPMDSVPVKDRCPSMGATRISKVALMQISRIIVESCQSMFMCDSELNQVIELSHPTSDERSGRSVTFQYPTNVTNLQLNNWELNSQDWLNTPKLKSIGLIKTPPLEREDFDRWRSPAMVEAMKRLRFLRIDNEICPMRTVNGIEEYAEVIKPGKIHFYCRNFDCEITGSHSCKKLNRNGTFVEPKEVRAQYLQRCQKCDDDDFNNGVSTASLPPLPTMIGLITIIRAFILHHF